MMNFLKYTLASTVLCGALLACNSGSDKKSKAVAENEIAVQDPVEAVSDEILASPNDLRLYLKRAELYAESRLFDLAIRDVQRAMSIDSMSSFVHVAMGDIYFRANNLRDARLAFEKALVLEPSDTEAALKLGEVHFLLRRYTEALDRVNDALKVNDKLEKGYFLKGYIYKELGDTVLSKSSFQTATEVNPDYYEAFIELGSLYAFEDNDLALDYFNTAIDIRKGAVEPLYNKAMYLQKSGRIEQAKAVYQKMLKIDPNSFLGYYNLGYIYLVGYEQFDTAAAYFDSVLAIRPDYVDALYNKGLCLEEMGDSQGSEEIYRSALDIDPQHTLSAMGLERLLD